MILQPCSCLLYTSYIDDIIVGAKESGPYFVLAQHVALPHARPEAGALESAIGVATQMCIRDSGRTVHRLDKHTF